MRDATVRRDVRSTVEAIRGMFESAVRRVEIIDENSGGPGVCGLANQGGRSSPAGCLERYST